MKRAGYIAKEWASFREMAVHTDASPLQVIETRRAFYGGARALLTLLLTGMSAGSDSTPEDEAKLAAIDEELGAFLRDVKEGRA